jgi:gas vesicle protein
MLMDQRYDEFDNAYEYDDNRGMKTLLTGLLVGGLIGAAVMLFMAPDSGKKTMRKLRKKTMKLRDHTLDTVDEAMKQARHRAGKVTAGVRKQAGHISDRSQHVLEDSRERVSDMVATGRKRVHLPGR